MKKRFVILLICLLTAAALCGCQAAEKPGLESAGISMDLPQGMENTSGQLGYGDYDFAYVGTDMAVFGSKGDLKADGIDANMTLMTCAENALQIAKMEAEILTAEKGYLYFVYDADTGINKFTNVTAFFENGEAFWMIQISSKSQAYDEAAVFAMLDSVEFK